MHTYTYTHIYIYDIDHTYYIYVYVVPDSLANYNLWKTEINSQAEGPFAHVRIVTLDWVRGLHVKAENEKWQ